MLKVLRKYNKWILVIGGTLLMVSFLVPQAIQQMGQARMGRAVGTMDGRKITLASYDQSRRELAALTEFFNRIGRPFPIPLDEERELEHWILLSREAENAGMVGGANEGASLLPGFAEDLVRAYYTSQYMQFGRANAERIAQNMMQQNPEEVQQLTLQAHEMLAEAAQRGAGYSRMTLDEFHAALAKLRGVDRMLGTYLNAERLSDRQAVTIAKGLADTVLVDSAFLSARELADQTLEPTPEELQTHFERFRDVRPGEGEFGIGYRLGPRVKLAWIELSRPKVLEAIAIPMLEATRHYTENRDSYAGTFEEERERIEAELRRVKADEVMAAAETVVRAEIAKALRALPKEGEYRQITEGWEAPSFVEIADLVVESVAQAEGVTIPAPAVQVRNDTWLDQQVLSELPGIGASMVTFGRQQFPFPQLALQVRELGGDETLGLQVGVPVSDLVATARDGSKYYYTILDAAPEGVPASIDEVLDREQLVADWRALRRYETLADSAQELASRGASEGLEEFAKSFGTYPAEPPIAEGETPPEPRQRVQVREDGRVFEGAASGLGPADSSEAAIESIRARAASIDPLTPIDSIPLEERVVAVPLPGQLGVLVAQINGVQPLTWETLPVFADYAARMRWQRTFQDVGVPVPFRFETLKERHAFAMKAGDEEDEGDGAAESEG